VPRETPHLEFKEAKSQFDSTKLYRYCVAIANEGGGCLVLGVTNTSPRSVVGTNAFQDVEAAADKAFSKLRFRVDAEAVAHPDGRVVVFKIPPRPRGTAYQHEGAYLMRSGESLVPMTEDRLRAIFDEGKPDWLSGVAVEDCDAEDVVRLLDTQSYFDLIKLPYPATRDGVIERFLGEKLIEASGDSYSITRLGAILFAKRIDEIEAVASKAARVIVYEGTGKLKTKLDQIGNKGYAVGFEGLVDYVLAQVPSNEVIEKALREEVKMFPTIAIRELVANALVHQDFSETGSSVRIELYMDRMEITNPGTPDLSPDRFIDEYRSRNEQLANLMRRFGICEEKGSGVDKVVNAAEVYQLPAPDFRVGERHTTAILFAQKYFGDMDREDRLRACYQHACLRYVMNEKMTNQSLRERFKLPERKSATVSQIISDAVNAGRIKPDAVSTSRKFAKYVPFWA